MVKGEAGHEAHISRILTAMAVVAPIRKTHKGKDWVGTVECPICKGQLKVSHAALNGHIWAKCETQGCVSWIE